MICMAAAMPQPDSSGLFVSASAASARRSHWAMPLLCTSTTSFSSGERGLRLIQRTHSWRRFSSRLLCSTMNPGWIVFTDTALLFLLLFSPVVLFKVVSDGYQFQFRKCSAYE